ncbi:MAG: hypothetical protein AAF481_18690 [Acidobacteriota bacterium]
MRDRAESTARPHPLPMSCRPPGAPPPWDEDSGFREIYLAEFEDAEARTTLRRLAALMVTLYREGFRTHPPTAESFMVRSLRALAADSRHLHGYAHMLGRRADEDELPRDMVPLSDLARDLAPAFAQLAERIERALPLP